MKVGDIYPTRYWGDVVVLSTVGIRSDIRFLLSENVRNSEIKKGNIRDREAHKDLGVNTDFPNRQLDAVPPIAAGTLFPSNLWGDMEVLEYRSNKEVVIRFVDSGNTYTVQKVNLHKGLVKDVDRCLSEAVAAKAAKDFQRRVADYPALLGRLNRRVSLAHEKSLNAARLLQRSVDKIFDTYSTVFTHPRYGKYRIESLHGDACVVKFLDTGFLQSALVRHAKSGRVRDYSQFSLEDQTIATRHKAAVEYLANREIRIKQACEWQKANPDKVRVRNRNRRAKRMGADGIHTKEQTDTLLHEQDHKCNSCGCCLHTNEKHLDHIMPLDLGGSNWIDNLQWLCQFCNNSKSNKHPDDWASEILTEAWRARREQRRLLDLKY